MTELYNKLARFDGLKVVQPSESDDAFRFLNAYYCLEQLFFDDDEHPVRLKDGLCDGIEEHLQNGKLLALANIAELLTDFIVALKLDRFKGDPKYSEIAAETNVLMLATAGAENQNMANTKGKSKCT